jgi:hypothetical protein
MGLLAKAASWRRLILGLHPNSGLLPVITDEETIRKREQRKKLLAEQARQLRGKT